MFISKIQANADDRSVYGNFWFSQLGLHTASGASVTPEKALTLPVVLACVRVLAETFAILSPRIYKCDGGKRTRLADHWLLDLLRSPNPFQTGFEWREMMQGHLALRGNAYNEIQTDRNGNITALMPMHPDRVKIQFTGNGDFDYKYVYRQRDGSTVSFARSEVWHIRGLSGDGIIGMSPLALARESIGMGLAAQDYGARYFKNDAKPSAWLEMPGNFKDKAQREQFRESLQEAQSGANRHKLAVLEFGMKLHELGVTNKDSQFLEARQFQVSDIARMFRVPPHLVGDLSKATFSNIEQQSLDFVIHTMTPWAERWESSAETSLLTEADTGIELDFDFSNLLRGDQAARSVYYHNGITDGWMTRADARAKEGYEPLPGLDKPLLPLNMAPLDENGDPRPASGANSSQPRPAENPSGPGARLQSVLEGNARRMARRVASGSALSARALSEALAVDLGEAAKWIAGHNPSESEDELTASLLELAK